MRGIVVTDDIGAEQAFERLRMAVDHLPGEEHYVALDCIEILREQRQRLIETAEEKDDLAARYATRVHALQEERVAAERMANYYANNSPTRMASGSALPPRRPPEHISQCIQTHLPVDIDADDAVPLVEHESVRSELVSVAERAKTRLAESIGHIKQLQEEKHALYDEKQQLLEANEQSAVELDKMKLIAEHSVREIDAARAEWVREKQDLVTEWNHRLSLLCESVVELTTQLPATDSDEVDIDLDMGTGMGMDAVPEVRQEMPTFTPERVGPMPRRQARARMTAPAPCRVGGSRAKSVGSASVTMKAGVGSGIQRKAVRNTPIVSDKPENLNANSTRRKAVAVPDAPPSTVRCRTRGGYRAR